MVYTILSHYSLSETINPEAYKLLHFPVSAPFNVLFHWMKMAACEHVLVAFALDSEQ